MSTPGNEPEECARDFIKNYYQYYPYGVYWYDTSNELILETSVKVANEVCCDSICVTGFMKTFPDCIFGISGNPNLKYSIHCSSLMLDCSHARFAPEVD